MLLKKTFIFKVSVYSKVGVNSLHIESMEEVEEEEEEGEGEDGWEEEEEEDEEGETEYIR